ncbi:N-acetyltransferase [Bacillus mycoides]|uniref:GNAT family N-acetyltransferase n=1 Tax=Bacillus mycoides TaxID=1405 RepID=UPI001C00D499|nr:GNAT family N-acetyltransferase [Bacillus mycoides]QWH20490.1 N-acetyltransferase [Bacillus mycoides]
MYILGRSGEREIQINTWQENNINLLFEINAPEMMKYLGGPETKEQILKRHKRYLKLGDSGQMFSITQSPDFVEVGSVGYWKTTWNDESVYEIGWSVLPQFQGKGIATLAVKLAIDAARKENKYNCIHAFPSIHNPASNAVCRKLNFTFISDCKFEYPPGNLMHCNNWRLKINTD